MARARRRRRKTKTRRAARIVRRAPAGKTHAPRKPAARTIQRHASAGASAPRQAAARTTQRRASAGGAPAPRQPAARAARRIRIALPPPTRAETLLLTLAKDLAGAPLDRALRTIADAFAPGAELPREVFNAWIKTRREKTASLALSWAREQLRLSLEETIRHSPRARTTLGLAPDTLAWLLLAACEAIAHEPPSAVPDRVRAVLELSGHAAPGA
jgi:hypothetical protein